MSYSRQSSNGVVVENIDGEIYINGVHTTTGRRSKYHLLGQVLAAGFYCLIGFILGTFV